MIVRNEERFLAACLASARCAVDEMIVVDTGSTDRTRAIAEAAGARVESFDWRDDFAAARNTGLALASGTHVLVLDADERLDERAAGVLRAAAADRTLLLGMLPLSDATSLDASVGDVVAGRARAWEPTWLPRFFRNVRELRFSRRVHETVTRDLDDALRVRGGRVAAVDAPIAHYGEVPGLRAELGRSTRNTRLLELALAEDPADGDLAGYLAMERFRAGDPRAARALGEKHLPPFFAALDRRAGDTYRPSPIQLASVLATCLLQNGEAGRALEVVREALRRCPEPHPNLVYLEGAALERVGRASEAQRAFEACLALHGTRFTIPANPGSTDAAPRLRLAELHLARGEPELALEFARHASMRGKFEIPARLVRAECAVMMDDPSAALAELGPFLQSKAPLGDALVLTAQAERALGLPDRGLERIASEPGTRWLERRRAARPPTAL